MNDKFEVRDMRSKEKFFVDDEYLNGYAKHCGWKATLVYMCLCRHADKGQKAFPSVATMAQKLGISERSVMRGINDLIEWNIVSTQRERYKSGIFKHNTYYLLDKTEWKNKPHDSQSGGHQVTHSHEPGDSQSPTHLTHSHPKDTHREGYTYKVGEADASRAYEEVERGDPSDFGEKKQPKRSTAKYPHAKEVFALFGEVDPHWLMNNTQRAAAENLYTHRGIENVKGALRFYQDYKDEPYMPEIDSPYDLDSKWKKLINKKKKFGV